MSDDDVMDFELDCVAFARAVADRDVNEVERLRGAIPADVLPLVLAELLNASQQHFRAAYRREVSAVDLHERKTVEVGAGAWAEIDRLRAEVKRWRDKTFELREILFNGSSNRAA